jgi:hypothetical protein
MEELLDDIEAVAVEIAHAPRPHLGGAGVIEDVGPPRLGDAVSRRGHRPPRLAGHDDHADRLRRGLEFVVVGHLGEMERVAGSGHEHGDPLSSHELQPREARHPSRGDRHRPAGHGRLEPAPEPGVGAERGGHEHAVAGVHTRAIEDRAPALHPPRPIGGGIEHGQRATVRAARLVVPHIGGGTVREVQRPARRRGALDEFLLERERPLRDGVERLDRGRVGKPPELRGVERVVGEDVAQQAAEPDELRRVDRGPRGRGFGAGGAAHAAIMARPAMGCPATERSAPAAGAPACPVAAEG